MERDLNKENRVLKEKVRTLQQENRRLRRLKGLEVEPLIGLLRRRGLQIFRTNPTDDLLLPDASSEAVQYEFYERLHHYSFRLFLRDLILHKEGAELSDLTRYCSDETARDYLHQLIDAGAVEEIAPLRFRVTTPVKSFGGTLEWYVSRLLRDEFAAPALYGVRFKGMDLSGDYDILSDFEGRLLYMEVKSSPPRGIELHQISDFLKRIDGILPEGAIFFNDTELRMKDKLVPFFEEALQVRADREGTETLPTERLRGEIFRFGKSLYLMNSRKGVKENMTVCLREMLRESNDFFE